MEVARAAESQAAKQHALDAAKAESGKDLDTLRAQLRTKEAQLDEMTQVLYKAARYYLRQPGTYFVARGRVSIQPLICTLAPTLTHTVWVRVKSAPHRGCCAGAGCPPRRHGQERAVARTLSSSASATSPPE